MTAKISKDSGFDFNVNIKCKLPIDHYPTDIVLEIWDNGEMIKRIWCGRDTLYNEDKDEQLEVS